MNCCRQYNGPGLDTGGLKTGRFSCQHFGGAEHDDDDWKKKYSKTILMIIILLAHFNIYILINILCKDFALCQDYSDKIITIILFLFFLNQTLPSVLF